MTPHPHLLRLGMARAQVLDLLRGVHLIAALLALVRNDDFEQQLAVAKHLSTITGKKSRGLEHAEIPAIWRNSVRDRQKRVHVEGVRFSIALRFPGLENLLALRLHVVRVLHRCIIQYKNRELILPHSCCSHYSDNAVPGRKRFTFLSTASVSEWSCVYA